MIALALRYTFQSLVLLKEDVALQKDVIILPFTCALNDIIKSYFYSSLEILRYSKVHHWKEMMYINGILRFELVSNTPHNVLILHHKDEIVFKELETHVRFL